MKLMGIDPGRQGAVAVYDKAEHRVTAHDMPDTTAKLHDLLAFLAPVKLCMIEKPFYPQMIGIKNATRIAHNYGVLTGALAWLSIPVHEVAPDKWKRALNLSSVKAASREKASQLFPDDAAQWARVMDDGRAEAALLAWYGLGFAK